MGSHEYLGGGIIVPAITLEEYLLKVLQEGPMTRGELKMVTGIPRSTLYDNLVKLILQDKVTKNSQSNKKQGRPRVYYELV